ncbi:hypothetical protein JAAARDRAFT_41881 [Jaapia argillacea MUCL 33604]|uniref:Pheromone n=1 Tax=Jaapia argillacea MUCL 33604 TaxID=933084 RepID=A0A067P6N5_9AGAM|nr:hypothetical protein JAAARDRAFT_41881 [Jaapia argillacea MUCL 33604]
MDDFTLIENILTSSDDTTFMLSDPSEVKASPSTCVPANFEHDGLDTTHGFCVIA